MPRSWLSLLLPVTVVVVFAVGATAHAAILVHLNDGCELHDTASKNGTFLNGQRIAGPTSIKAGDEIRLCDRTMVFAAGAEAPAPRGEGPDSKTVVEN